MTKFFKLLTSFDQNIFGNVKPPQAAVSFLSGSIRRTYFDQTIAKVIEDVPDYYFYDGNFKAYFLTHSTIQTIDGNFYEPLFHIESDGIGEGNFIPIPRKSC